MAAIAYLQNSLSSLDRDVRAIFKRLGTVESTVDNLKTQIKQLELINQIQTED